MYKTQNEAEMETMIAESFASSISEAQDDLIFNRPRWQIMLRKIVGKVRRLGRLLS